MAEHTTDNERLTIQKLVERAIRQSRENFDESDMLYTIELLEAALKDITKELQVLKKDFKDIEEDTETLKQDLQMCATRLVENNDATETDWIHCCQKRKHRVWWRIFFKKRL